MSFQKLRSSYEFQSSCNRHQYLKWLAKDSGSTGQPVLTGIISDVNKAALCSDKLEPGHGGISTKKQRKGKELLFIFKSSWVVCLEVQRYMNKQITSIEYSSQCQLTILSNVHN